MPNHQWNNPSSNSFALSSEEYDLAVPNAASLMQSLRAFGYDIATAVADLIDNSITAQANRISVQFEWNNGNPWISISDNGYGMTEDELFEAMKPGSKNPLDERSENDLGRFGLGLKTASLSQCKRLTVASKKDGGRICCRCWDLDVVTQKNAWLLLKVPTETAATIIQKHLDKCPSGTIVIWEKIDRIIPGEHVGDEEYQRAFLNYAQSVKERISVVFSSYMSGPHKVAFEMNGREISMWDPFMTDNPLTTRMPTEYLYVNGNEVKIKTFILPHQKKLSSNEFSLYAGAHGWNAQQGFYIFRNNRLIVEGSWLLNGFEKAEQYRLARIRIDIGNETDSEWNIDVRKSTAVPPISIQNDIKRIAIAARRESATIFRNRGKKLARRARKEQCFVWHQNIRNGKLGYTINRDHPIIREMINADEKNQIKKLLTLIEETIPVPMIISDYSERADNILTPFEGKSTNDYDPMIKTLYDVYRKAGCTIQEAIENIAGTEPYIYEPEKVTLFCEREDIPYGE